MNPETSSNTMDGDGRQAGDASATSALGVLGVGVLLLGLLGSVLFLAIPRGGELGADEVLDDLFAGVTRPLPYEFAAEDARLLPSGERVVTFGPLSEDAGDGPVALTIIEYPPAKGEKVLLDQFRRLRFESGDEMGHGGGRGGGRHGKGKGDGKDKPKPKLQEKAFLVWHGFDATFARLRHEHTPPEKPEKDGELGDEPGDESGDESGERRPRPSPKKFHEVIRVNLSTGGRCIIAYVRFAEGATGDKDAAAEIVAAFTPRS